MSYKTVSLYLVILFMYGCTSLSAAKKAENNIFGGYLSYVEALEKDILHETYERFYSDRFVSEFEARTPSPQSNADFSGYIYVTYMAKENIKKKLFDVDVKAGKACVVLEGYNFNDRYVYTSFLFLNERGDWKIDSAHSVQGDRDDYPLKAICPPAETVGAVPSS